ncbi:hypothetical protein F0M18_08675 [Pseudohalioglobus sediminis]|uniref:Uncharacterized protein n=1 Tax=Pseudohalioglobus sediminis TaxID=2606449 RepID=A0A5B0X3I3_9GAMM|nr:hypothetical protein [Pseudohalioglobus sediminis]KAA1192719.1 hypothetical protein F0M18_08675 [Pseudohalioglobus sediminis]
MTEFSFDRAKSFEENRTDFLESTKDIDAEMAKLLIAHSDKLISVVREGERDTKARITFNEAIATALDYLLTQEVDEESE